MTEDLMPPSNVEDQHEAQKHHFKIDTLISGSPYTIEGDAPEEPGHFRLVVSIPDDVWAKLKLQIDENRASDPAFDVQYGRLKLGPELGDGKVGSVWVNEAATDDDTLAIGISNIHSDTQYLPESSEYHDAFGVGSFILDSLCAIADTRGWRIYLEPMDKGGKLNQDQLVEWYERHGFEHEKPSDKDKSSAFGSMIRFPKPVDMAQPVAQALSAERT